MTRKFVKRSKFFHFCHNVELILTQPVNFYNNFENNSSKAQFCQTLHFHLCGQNDANARILKQKCGFLQQYSKFPRKLSEKTINTHDAKLSRGPVASFRACARAVMFSARVTHDQSITRFSWRGADFVYDFLLLAVKTGLGFFCRNHRIVINNNYKVKLSIKAPKLAVTAMATMKTWNLQSKKPSFLR